MLGFRNVLLVGHEIFLATRSKTFRETVQVLITLQVGGAISQS